MKIALTLTGQHLLNSIFSAAAQSLEFLLPHISNESENYKYLSRGRGERRRRKARRQGQMKRFKCLALAKETYSSFVRIREPEPVFKALRSTGILA